jgi:glycosyltransferase involved in cell wall biosynthesis
MDRFETRLIAGSLEDGEADMGYYVREHGVEATYVHSMARSLNPLADLRTTLELYRLFRSERPAVVHTHTAKAGTAGRLAAFLAGVPVRIHTFHGHVLGGGYFAPWKNRIFLEIERQLARITTRIVVLTDLQRDEMAFDLEVAPAERFEVISLGLELDRFQKVLAPGERARRRASTRNALGLAPDEPVVGIVGRLVPVKNHELLMDALAVMDEAPGETPTVLVVGGGDERAAELRAYAEGLGVDHRFRWLGWRKDLPDLFAAMDVVALTSLDEGTPVALIEAMAAGCSIVSRSVGGVRRVLEDGAWGTLIHHADPLELAEGLRRALDHPPTDEIRAAMSRSALERYSAETLCAAMSDLYETELERLAV